MTYALKVYMMITESDLEILKGCKAMQYTYTCAYVYILYTQMSPLFFRIAK